MEILMRRLKEEIVKRFEYERQEETKMQENGWTTNLKAWTKQNQNKKWNERERWRGRRYNNKRKCEFNVKVWSFSGRKVRFVPTFKHPWSERERERDSSFQTATKKAKWHASNVNSWKIVSPPTKYRTFSLSLVSLSFLQMSQFSLWNSLLSLRLSQTASFLPVFLSHWNIIKKFKPQFTHC